MNDLRKDQLIKIGQLLRREYISTNQLTWVNIIDKLQSMIDNYCEHPSVTPCSDCEAVVCDKCGEYFKYE